MNSGGPRVDQTGGGSANPKRERQPIIQPNFPLKLHENERNLTETGAHVPRLPSPLDPPMIRYFQRRIQDFLRWGRQPKGGVDLLFG